MSVSISGRILDERYTQLLMEQTDLTLTQVILLDRVQKKQPLDREEYKLLKSAGLVEGRFPSIMVSGQLAKMTGETGRHIRERGFDKQYYLDLILALVSEHGPVPREQVNEVLLPKLPERMTDEQKQNKVKNLLQELRREGKIETEGPKNGPLWKVAAKATKGAP